MNKKRIFAIAALLLSLCCIGASFYFDSEGVKTVAGTLIGIGGGLFSVSVSSLVTQHVERKHPELERQKKIEYKDERNTMIRNRAKAKAGDITQWLIMAVAYLNILISAPLWMTLAVVTVYAAYNVIGMVLMSKYQSEL